MTEQEMNKLADIIVDKIIKRQSEYDAAFVANLNKEQDEYFLFSTSTASEKIEPPTLKEQIEALEQQRKIYVQEENYELAGIVAEKIKELVKKLWP